MTASVSTNYRELSPYEIEHIAAETASAWQDAAIPMRQYEACVKSELVALRDGIACAPFAALGKCLRKLPIGCTAARPKVLDVGASSGYYSEVLRLLNFKCDYRACDFSPWFRELAMRLYPGIVFDVMDAHELLYPDNSFPIVLHGATLMHSLNYAEMIKEAARVASRYVLFHRTPVVINTETKFFEKEGYDCRMLEIHFNEAELLKLFAESGLELLHTECVFWDASSHYGHRSYLLKKKSEMEREWERA